MKKWQSSLDTDQRKSPEKGSRGQKVLQWAALLVWAALIIFILINKDKITAEAILEYTPSNVWLAAIVMLALFALKTMSVVFYSGVLFAASGLLFDLPAALLVNVLGILVMLTEGYMIGHFAGSGLVSELSEKYPKFAEFTGLQEEHPFMFALLIRMLKFINYDLGSMYMGASGIRMLPFLGGSMIAMVPEMVLFAFAGNGIDKGTALPAVWALAAYVALTIASLLGLRVMLKRKSAESEYKTEYRSEEA